MGACFQMMTVPGDTIRNDVMKRFAEVQAQCTREYGTNPYNGTWSTCNGLRFENKTFDNVADAEEWLADRASKWDDALCVTAKWGSGTVWVIGAWCAE
jgi:hypothetical protein